MTRRSFFSLLAAPVVAPMVPEKPKPMMISNNVVYGTQTLSSGSQFVPTVFYPIALGPCDADTKATLHKLIDEINKEVKRGAVTLTATGLKR